MKQWIVYYNMGIKEDDRTAYVYGMTVQQAVNQFIHDHAPVGTILAIIEKDRTL